MESVSVTVFAAKRHTRENFPARSPTTSPLLYMTNLECRKILLVESGIPGFGMRNTSQGIRNPTNDWNWVQNPSSSDKIWDAVSGIRNPRCGNQNFRIVLDSVACEQQTHFRSSLLSLRKIGGKEATTGIASAVRRVWIF